MRYLLPLIIFLIVAVFLWQGLRKDPHQLPSALIGKPVPQFSYPNLLTPSRHITQQKFLGQVSLLNIWGSWCQTCYAEHPVLLEIARSNNIAIYGLNYKDNRIAALQWLEKYGNPYKDIIFDAQGTLAMELGVYGTPETFLIDPKGIIRYKHVGALDATVWEQEIKPLIQKW
jgi:cytochrome c biogenesis protein CcmG/thiol:disulfide interchange protein DsbE